jgi:hypothetical protein
MRKLLVAAILIVASLGTVFAQKRSNAGRETAVAVAFIDKERVQNDEALDSFQFFLKPIQEIVKRDFPGVQLRIVENGELVYLPDGTRLNVRNMEPPIGIVLSMRGKKRRVLSGVQTEVLFACAASAFFHRSSPACPK